MVSQAARSLVKPRVVVCVRRCAGLRESVACRKASTSRRQAAADAPSRLHVLNPAGAAARPSRSASRCRQRNRFGRVATETPCQYDPPSP